MTENNPDKKRQSQSLIQWLRDMINNHSGLLIGLFPALIVALGLTYQAVFFMSPLDVPIFQLSSPADFFLPGVRQLIFLVLVLLFAITVTTFFWVLICLLISLRYLPLLIWNSLQWVFLSVLVWVAIYFVHNLGLLMLWLLYMPMFLIYAFFKKLRDFSHSVRWILKNEYEMKILSLDTFKETWLKIPRNKATEIKNSISELRKTLGEIRVNIETKWSKRVVLQLASMLVITFVFTVMKADYDRDLIQKYGEAGEEFGKRFLSVSTVEAIFRFGECRTQNLLQIGSTSDFVLFWQQKNTPAWAGTNSPENTDTPGTTSGSSLIVPKSNILQIRPRKTNGERSGGCLDKSQGSTDVVVAIDRLNSSLTEKLQNLPEKLPAPTAVQCPDQDYSKLAATLEEIKSIFVDTKDAIKNR